MARLYGVIEEEICEPELHWRTLRSARVGGIIRPTGLWSKGKGPSLNPKRTFERRPPDRNLGVRNQPMWSDPSGRKGYIPGYIQDISKPQSLSILSSVRATNWVNSTINQVNMCLSATFIQCSHLKHQAWWRSVQKDRWEMVITLPSQSIRAKKTVWMSVWFSWELWHI